MDLLTTLDYVIGDVVGIAACLLVLIHGFRLAPLANSLDEDSQFPESPRTNSIGRKATLLCLVTIEDLIK